MPRGARGGTSLLIVAAGLVACSPAANGPGRPVAMPMIKMTTCVQARCGPASSCVDTEHGALCTCGPGYARAEDDRCMALVEDRTSGCTVPEHCARGEVCERLTGRCRARSPNDCAGSHTGRRSGKRITGDFCHSEGSEQVTGCGPLGDDDFCKEGLVCAPTGAHGWSGPLCGHPRRIGGVCRATCDPCAASTQPCPAGESCFVVEGVAGGVCLPRGAPTADEQACGHAVCAPGDTCELGGMLGGAAHGRCERICKIGEPCKGKCQPAWFTGRNGSVGVCR